MPFQRNATVLITGAGRGIGKRLAIGFAQAGARVGLLGRNQAELDVTKLEIEHAGGIALRLRADVCKFEDVAAAIDRITVTWGSLHALIANAAVQGPIGPFAENKPRDWHELFEINVIGVMNSCRAVLPAMIQRRSGKIVVISGTGATNPRPLFAAYSAAKAAVVRFAESLAEEVREHNIQVNSMFPGEAYTNMTDEILHAGYRAGSDEIEAAERVTDHRGNASGQANATRAFPCLGPVEPRHGEVDPRSGRLEEARARERPPRLLHVATTAEVTTMVDLV